jgi:lipid-A-disaccharide synthase-like uncharacterized protein
MIVAIASGVWSAVGWMGQGVFTFRVLHQWWASERAGRSVVPRAFWLYSLLGTALVLVYAVARQDAVFVVGSLVQGLLFARNLHLSRPNVSRRPPSALLVMGMGLLLAVAIAFVASTVFRAGAPRTQAWLAVGAAGQALWMGRFAVQWWVSERDGFAHLPASFFWTSIVGAALLCAYAASQADAVNVAAYALNPIPYARNLVLLRREARAQREAGADARPPRDPADPAEPADA